MRSGSRIPPLEKAETADYVIFKKDNVIYAKNGETGAIEISGTDAQTVIQNAMGNLVQGDKIFIKDDLTLESMLTINKDFITFKFGKLISDFDGITILIQAHNVEIIGNRLHRTHTTTNKSMIRIDESHNHIHINSVHDESDSGIGININQDGAYYNYICISYLVAKKGIRFDAGDGETIAHNRIEVGSIISPGAGESCEAIRFKETGTGIVARNTVFRTLFQSRGLTGDYGVINQGENTLIDFHVSDLGTDGVSVWNLADNHLRIYGGHLGSKDNLSNVGTMRLTDVRFSEGYSENSGTATILNGNTSVQFAHGLADTPTFVTLGATHDEVADAIWSADATNITITVPAAVSADRDISWYAEYKP